MLIQKNEFREIEKIAPIIIQEIIFTTTKACYCENHS